MGRKDWAILRIIERFDAPSSIDKSIECSLNEISVLDIEADGGVSEVVEI
jgi:hypothetical protein